MTIDEKIKELIAATIEETKIEITDDLKLFDDLGYDSLDFVELNMEIEEEFGLVIDPDEGPEQGTVKELVDFYYTRIKEAL